MTVTSRAYENRVDHQRLMQFLRDLHTKTGSFENWLPVRFENNRREMDPGIRVWEDDGEIVGFVIPEEPFYVFCPASPRLFVAL